MALTPNQWEQHEIDSYQNADVFTEGVASATIREGFYRDPSMRDRQLIERELTVRNQYSTVVYRESEEWDYDLPNGPPTRYERTVEASVFLPAANISRSLIEVEHEITVFWTFTPWSKDVLAFRKEVSGYVVHDLKPLADLDATAQAAAQARGYSVVGVTDAQKRMVIATSRWWREAVRDRTVVEKADANQVARWVSCAIVEETEITEEVDRYTRWIHRKNQVRPDQNELIGPEYFKKESHTYRSTFPVIAPAVDASDAGAEGVRVEVTGGGATVDINLTTGSKRIERGPDSYRIFRKLITEPEHEPGGDPFKIFGTPPVPRPRRQVISPVFVGDFNGVPDPEGLGLPTASSHEEPHDPSPVDPDSWRHVADVENEAEEIDREVGHATIIDPDVVDAGVYRYVAVAVVQESESPLSPSADVTKSGDGPSGSSITVRVREDGSVEGDIEVPADVAYLPRGLEDYGETKVLDVPALVTPVGWPEAAQDRATLTVSCTATTEEITVTHTPRENPDEWKPGKRCRIIDRVGPRRRQYGHILTPWSIIGEIKTSTDTTTTIERTNADGHQYPVGAEVELLAQSYDPRSDTEGGDTSDGTVEALVLAIGTRQWLASREESFSVTVESSVPLLGLAAGQTVYLDEIGWDAFGNDVWLRSQIEQVPWRLRGWSIEVARGQGGRLEPVRTTLVLEER